jgi:hypothetical protein
MAVSRNTKWRRKQAARLVFAGKSLPEVAQALGVKDEVVRRWIYHVDFKKELMFLRGDKAMEIWLRLEPLMCKELDEEYKDIDGNCRRWRRVENSINTLAEKGYLPENAHPFLNNRTHSAHETHNERTHKSHAKSKAAHADITKNLPNPADLLKIAKALAIAKANTVAD